MSFHEDMFHETKSERKYYEGKKQDALRNAGHLIEIIKQDQKYEGKLTNQYGQEYNLDYLLDRAEYIYELVRKI